jgi:UDP:flavonoid glycosyltransferase YjiC (YdhE family)
MFDVLLTTKRPFILSRASMFFGPQSEQFENRLKEAQEAGSCLVSEWTPQVKILAHKSTSVFVTHGGWNSTTEAIAANVPTVYWPFTADQPATAMRQ